LKPLIIGATGQLGHCLALRARTLGLEHAAVSRNELDLGQCLRDPEGFEEQLRQLLVRHRPSHLFLAAAYTAVDRAESEPALAAAVNSTAPALLGAVAGSLGIPVVHYSTDYVFNGQRPLDEAYLPRDPTDPQSVYGQTKAAGERGLLDSGSDCLIFRTSWVFSAHGTNFLKTMLRLAQSRDHLRVVADQVGAPTSAEWLAQVTLEVCERWPHAAAQRGVYHLTAAGHVSWHGFARALLEEARRLAPTQPWAISSDAQIEAITTEAFNAPAPRPRNSQLDCRTTEADFQIKRPDWQDQMRAVMNALLA